MSQEWRNVKSHAREMTLAKKKQLEQAEEEIRRANRPQPVYEAFPHRHSPLVDDLLPWVESGAYMVMYGDTRGNHRVLWHRDCPGTTSAALKPEVYKFAENHPVIVMDLSACPLLLREHEWPYSIMRADPVYRNCTCSFSRYIVEDEAVKREYYKLEMPYFYLCNLNLEGDQGFYRASLPHEQLLKEEMMMRKVVQ